jgi:hypothetical protein
MPVEIEETFRRFVTAELTTIDSKGRPITWPVTPFYDPGGTSVRVTTALGYPRKAHDARRNPKVALLFSDATGSGIERPSMVLVQGSAEVDDGDLDANRARYLRDLREKPTGGPAGSLPEAGGRRFDWYFTRVYLHVRPERVYVWRDGDCGATPELYGAPASGADAMAASPYRGKPHPHRRIGEIGSRYESAVLSMAGADGFPLSVRLPMTADRRGRSIAIDVEPGGLALQPGPVCVTAHDHDPELHWTRNFQVRGELVHDPHGWVVTPHRMVGGFELAPGGAFVRAVANIPKIRRFRQAAVRERKRREAGR